MEANVNGSSPLIMGTHSDRVRNAMVVLLGTLFILTPAIINGFPFVYPDTGTYLASAFRGEVPVDRPYWYGVFMRISSLGGHTFWGIVTAQALLCSLYVFRTVRLLVAPGRSHRSALIVLAVLAALSGVGYFAGQLIPDIFTAIGILGITHFLFVGKHPLRALPDGMVVLWCCWVHLSNLVIVTLCGALLLLVMARAFNGGLLMRWTRLGILSLAAWCGLGIANRAVDGEFYLSRGGQAFLVARMIDTGMLRPWLEEHCATGEYRLCHYIDSLPPSGTHLLWADAVSPMHKEGGWLATKPEYDRVVRSVLTEPEYLGWFMGAGVRSTADLLTRWTICSALVNQEYRRSNSPPYFMIAGTIPSGLAPYLASLQNGGRGELDMTVPDRLYATFMFACLLAGVVLFFIDPVSASGLRLRALLVFAAGAVIINCWVCATFSAVEDRYLGRVSWVLPLFVIGIAASCIASKRARTVRVEVPRPSR